MIEHERFMELQKSMYERANTLKYLGYTRLGYVGQFTISLVNRNGERASVWINLDENCIEEERG